MTRHRLKIVLAVVGLLVVEVAAQLIYPRGISLPLSVVGGESVGFLGKDDLQERVIDSLPERKVLLNLGDKTGAGVKFNQLGAASFNSEALDEIYDYPLGWRFVPFSFLMFRADLTELSFNFDGKKLDVIVDEKTVELNKTAVNAEFKATSDGVEVVAEQSGYVVNKDDVLAALMNSKYSLTADTALAIKHEKVNPDITAADYGKVKVAAEAAIGKQVFFMFKAANGKTERVDLSAPERAALLGASRAENGEMTLTLKDDELAKVFGTLEPKAAVKPGVTTIKTLNGATVSRVNGANGQGLDFDSYKQQLSDALLGAGPAQIELQVKVIPPTVRYEREYNHTHAGLQAYLDDVTAGKEISVAVQQLGGETWGAQAGGDKRVVAASTYKLFVAQFIMSKIDTGQLSWGSGALGTTVDGCMQTMIINSDNSCPEHWLSVYGYSAVNGFVNALGYGNVFSSGLASTTANDLKKLLINLYYASGSGFSSPNAGKLIGLMSSQRFRQGVPAGSGGAVANKVGFLNGYLNDAAIVYHPQGTYVIVVMTNNQSWAKIAEITRQVEQIMYGA